MFQALVITNPMVANLQKKDSVLLLEEMCVNESSDPIETFVKMLEDRDSRIMALFVKTTQVVEL